jgi:hypothetical protein
MESEKGTYVEPCSASAQSKLQGADDKLGQTLWQHSKQQKK